MRVLNILLLFAVLYVFLALLFYIFQSRVIFYPSSTPADFVYSFPYPHQEIFIDTDDDARIHGLLFTKENSRGTILYLHGNAGSLTGWGWIADDFQQFDYDLLVVDYRTFGKSTGRLSEQTLYADALAWYNFLMEKAPDRETIIYGRSIGTGVAVDLATRASPSMLLLESPFHNLPALAWHHFPVLPFRLLSRFRFQSDDKAKKIQCPVHIFHGTNDNIIPFRFGKMLYERFPAERATFHTIDGGGHNDLTNFDAYHQALEKALRN
jgi:uncharacterized protein